jgi:hypothetical protein
MTKKAGNASKKRIKSGGKKRGGPDLSFNFGLNVKSPRGGRRGKPAGGGSV